MKTAANSIQYWCHHMFDCLLGFCWVTGTGFFILWSPIAAAEIESERVLNAKVRFMHYDRDFEDTDKDRVQNGFGFTVNYLSPQFLDYFRVGLSGQLSVNTIADGLQREDVFYSEDGHVKGHHLLGEGYLEVLPATNTSIKIGRQRHKSMFLVSKTRVLPSTFQGVNFSWKVPKSVKLYGAVYNKWSARAHPDFVKFGTDLSKKGAIDYVMLFGAQYRGESVVVNAEYLRSDDYLQKLGIKTNYSLNLSNNNKLVFHAALFGMRKAGDLFAVGADDGVLDVSAEDQEGASLDYSSVAGYLGMAFQHKQSELGLYFTKIGNPWLEDNFSGDHGANPFPANTIGPDLTNKGESIWVLEYKQKWHAVGLPNLKTRLAYAYGYGAENFINKALGHGSERWLETDVRYQFLAVPSLQTRLRYRIYRSEEFGSVKGIKEDQNDLRLTVDYTYHF